MASMCKKIWTHEKNDFHMIFIIKTCDGKFVIVGSA